MTIFENALVKRVAFGVAAFALAVMMQSNANAQSTSGFLKCNISSGASFVFGSSRNLRCVYDQTGGRPVEYYEGKIDKFGVDIGFVQSGVILWSVVAPATARGPGKLSGTYTGASADVVAGAGLGANVLVGSNNIQLNPVSMSGATGLNIAAGVASVTLRYVSQR